MGPSRLPQKVLKKWINMLLCWWTSRKAHPQSCLTLARSFHRSDPGVLQPLVYVYPYLICQSDLLRRGGREGPRRRFWSRGIAFRLWLRAWSRSGSQIAVDQGRKGTSVWCTEKSDQFGPQNIDRRSCSS